ncbi:uncharacterized protein EDB93DRAFT_1103449 [Suillus bovinus]|uniref:uncharacterized protein n=1 Tax=Suillus bovinus TaxID=48563 RepID=UPI001B88626E|nr:uncharacterized protein EDB93DRAFT_1103449 [Suillus bovinus]KAG2150755.1 hypothetical protein EDB93DRAFT_1103449 [Suillus bovinus]
MQEMSSDEEPGGVGMDEMDEMVACGVKSGHNEAAALNHDGVTFKCISCHLAAQERESSESHSAYFGFYRNDIYRFCPLSSQSVTFQPCLSVSSPYFPSGGIAFHELIFDVASKSKSDHYQLEVDPFLGHEHKKSLYVSGRVDSFLNIILTPWQLLIKSAKDSYLWLLFCGALVNNADSFSYLQTSVFNPPENSVTLSHVRKSGSCWIAVNLEAKLVTCGEEIRKAILAVHKEQEEEVPLPASLKKGINDTTPNSSKAMRRWRKERLHKLFKQEINEYDKAEQERKGLEHSIKYQTLHAWEWFDKMTASQKQEVKSAMEKWNREGAPEESQAVYRKNHLKRTLEDFSKQIERTMGCRMVMFVSHKKKAPQSLAVSVHESEPQNAKKRFLNDPRPNFVYPSEGQDHADAGSDNGDDDSGPVIPEVILDEDGYAKLPMCDGISLKGQHELIRSIFHASYKVCTGGSRPVPWGTITSSSSNYLESGSVPTGFMVKDPSHMKTEEKLVIFIKAKVSDLRNGDGRRKSKAKRVSGLDADEEDQDRPVLNIQPVVHSNQAETTPDDISITERYTYLESLSRHENYLELVDALKDLAILANQKPNSEQHTDLPIWADWSWNGFFLPEDVHISYDTLKASLNKLITSLITGAPSAMPVVLGIGLLYRESKRVMKFEEDEANSNTPAYLPGSVFDLQFLVALDDAVREVLANIIEHIERLTKDALSEDDDVEDNGVDGGKEVAVNQESGKVGEDIPMQQMEIQEKQEEEQEELEEVQKGRKRRLPQASTSKSKKPRTEPEVRRSPRARQPSKKAQK